MSQNQQSAGSLSADGAGLSPEEARALLARPTITPDELLSLKIIPLSRMSIYAACERGEIENVRFGRRIAILTGPLKKRLGMEAA